MSINDDLPEYRLKQTVRAGKIIGLDACYTNGIMVSIHSVQLRGTNDPILIKDQSLCQRSPKIGDCLVFEQDGQIKHLRMHDFLEQYVRV